VSDTNLKQPDRITLLVELEDKKVQYVHARRPVFWFLLMLGILLFIFILCIFVAGLVGQAFIDVFAGLTAALLGLFIIFMLIFFLVSRVNDGFGGFGRIRDIMSLRREIENLQARLRILEEFQEHLHPRQVRYRNELPKIIFQFQHQANFNRRLNYTIQVFIILFSLLVTGLTSGLTGLVGLSNIPWIAALFSFFVSFLTAIAALFRFHDRGFNLQKTADDIQLEVTAADLRIFNYEGLSDEQALIKLAASVERLRDEQRKRQQQLEQASLTKHPQNGT